MKSDGRVHVHVHEQSYYIVHYIRRKEEGKEGRKKRTQQPQCTSTCACACTCTHVHEQSQAQCTREKQRNTMAVK